MQLKRSTVRLGASLVVMLIAACSTTLPTASLDGSTISVSVGDLVQLDGSQSKDPNKLALRYDTTFVTVPAGFTGSITNPTSSRPSFVPTVVGDYVVQLVVSDKDVSSAAVQVT